MAAENIPVEPSILYWGTPAILNSTENPDGTFNLAPISLVFCVGVAVKLGFKNASQTAEDLFRTGEIVINLVADDQVDAVNNLSMLTGSNPVPDGKALRGYRYEPDKFRVAGLTP